MKTNNYYTTNYDSLESKLKSENIGKLDKISKEDKTYKPYKSDKSEKYKTLKSILDTSEFYKNCMYCGKIYEGDYDKVIYQNGTGPLGREFNDYNISTWVGPCCMGIYRKGLKELTEYNPKNTKAKSITKTRPSYVYQNKWSSMT